MVLIRDGREVGTKAWSRSPGSARSPRSARPVATPMAATTCSPRRPADSRSNPSMRRRSRTWSPTSTPLDDEVGDEPRAERLAAAAIRRFVRYLDLMRARDGESTGGLDIRVEIESHEPAPDDRRRVDAERRPVPSSTTDAGPPTRRDLTSPTIRPSSPTCSRASSRSSSRGARPCSRRQTTVDRLRWPDRPARARSPAARGDGSDYFTPDPGDARRGSPQLTAFAI